MTKQTKEEFLNNVREHADNQILWGVFDWREGGEFVCSSLQISKDRFEAESNRNRVDLDLRLADLYEKCLAKEQELIAAVRKFNAECKARLEDK